jgi:GDP-4-dehydro-6-deoxy-D-mannose reductase
MRVLVTGAGGFVGEKLLAQLTTKGFEVAGFDIDVDVSDGDAVRDSIARVQPDAVIHLAAISSIAATLRDPAATFRVNFLGTHHVLEACRTCRPGCRVLFVGSGSVYGTAAPGSPPFTEDSPLHAESPYARTKAAGDILAQLYSSRGLDIVRARPFNHTGAGRQDAFVESSFARQVAEIEAGARSPRLEVGNLDSVRDFLHVDDVIDAYCRLIHLDVPDGAYNVASGQGRRIGDVLDRLLEMADLRGRVEIHVDPARFRATDRAVGDASRLRERSGWSPAVDFDSTLRELLDGWREHERGQQSAPPS